MSATYQMFDLPVQITWPAWVCPAKPGRQGAIRIDGATFVDGRFVGLNPDPLCDEFFESMYDKSEMIRCSTGTVLFDIDVLLPHLHADDCNPEDARRDHLIIQILEQIREWARTNFPPTRLVIKPCQVCGHIFGNFHRIIPGSQGGKYTFNNVVSLCPNHHAAIHFLMRLSLKDIESFPHEEHDRLSAYKKDKKFWNFWTQTIMPHLERGG